MFFVVRAVKNDKKQHLKTTKHWKLSSAHQKHVQTIINKEYEKLWPFFNKDELNNIFERIQISTENILLLASNTPFFANIDYKIRNNAFDGVIVKEL